MKSNSAVLKLERSRRIHHKIKNSIYVEDALQRQIFCQFLQHALVGYFPKFLGSLRQLVFHTHWHDASLQKGLLGSWEFKTVNSFCCFIFCLRARREKLVLVKSESEKLTLSMKNYWHQTEHWVKLGWGGTQRDWVWERRWLWQQGFLQRNYTEISALNSHLTPLAGFCCLKCLFPHSCPQTKEELKKQNQNQNSSFHHTGCLMFVRYLINRCWVGTNSWSR